MAGIIKNSVTKVTNNPLFAVAGAVAGFYGAKKMNVTNVYYKIGLVVLGGVVGAFASSYVKSSMSEPKKTSVK
jgi:uncharacterized membrane protein YfcA